MTMYIRRKLLKQRTKSNFFVAEQPGGPWMAAVAECVTLSSDAESFLPEKDTQDTDPCHGGLSTQEQLLVQQYEYNPSLAPRSLSVVYESKLVLFIPVCVHRPIQLLTGVKCCYGQLLSVD